MVNSMEILCKCPLFQNMNESDILNVRQCMNLVDKTYPAGSYIYMLNDTVNYIGIILEGSVEIVKENIAGNCHIVAILDASNLFGEGIVCTANRISPVTVKTRTVTRVLLMPYEKLLHTCHNACGYHTQLIHNMMLILGEKNSFLNYKIDLLMLKGMRQKLASYLFQMSSVAGSNKFILPYNRNELAQFLNVSRTSMSRELARMKEEGMIDYHLNCIQILSYELLQECMLEE